MAQLYLSSHPLTMRPWLLLLIAAFFEIIWAAGLKSTAGFTRLGPSAAVLAAMGLSLWLLALAARSLPIGTAYAVWTGIGAVGTALVGIIWLKEPASAARLVCISLIVTGVVGLKVFAKST
jgi:quaternary ammonium compound-resistance protein SugE